MPCAGETAGQQHSLQLAARTLGMNLASCNYAVCMRTTTTCMAAGRCGRPPRAHIINLSQAHACSRCGNFGDV